MSVCSAALHCTSVCSATKHALRTVAEGLRIELASRGLAIR